MLLSSHLKFSTLLLLICCFPQVVLAQSDREAAVEIDLVEVADTDPVGLEVLVRDLKHPWSIAFLPTGQKLIVEKHTGVRLVSSDNAETRSIEGLPEEALLKSDSGFLDIVLDPEFSENRFVYLSFVEGNEAKNRTAIWKARFDGNEFLEGRTIFQVNNSKKGPSHPGGRMIFLPDQTLLLTVGDGYDYAQSAQDMKSHLGKILRLTREGEPATDNPFFNHPDAAAEIYSSGHRNIQGLVFDPKANIIWSHEHGPRGGDEVNHIIPGGNYGWPEITHGVDYDGSIISPTSHDPAYERSQFIWSPSVAPSGMTIYRGGNYPDFEDKFLVGGLASRTLIRLRQGQDTGLLVEEERLLKGLNARIRDVRTGPDGLIYLLTDDDNGQLLRLAPPNRSHMGTQQSDQDEQIDGDESKTEDLEFLIGNWEGEAEHYYPREPGKPGRVEKSRAKCRYILQKAYILCKTVWTRGDGQERRFHLHFNALDSAYQVLFLYDGWPRHVAYPLTLNANRDVFLGSSEFENSDGTEGSERVEWSISNDQNEITVREFNHLATDPEDYWAHYFKFTWRRVG